MKINSIKFFENVIRKISVSSRKVPDEQKIVATKFDTFTLSGQKANPVEGSSKTRDPDRSYGKRNDFYKQQQDFSKKLHETEVKTQNVDDTIPPPPPPK